MTVSLPYHGLPFTVITFKLISSRLVQFSSSRLHPPNIVFMHFHFACFCVSLIDNHFTFVVLCVIYEDNLNGNFRHNCCFRECEKLIKYLLISEIIRK